MVFDPDSTRRSLFSYTAGAAGSVVVPTSPPMLGCGREELPCGRPSRRVGRSAATGFRFLSKTRVVSRKNEPWRDSRRQRARRQLGLHTLTENGLNGLAGGLRPRGRSQEASAAGADCFCALLSFMSLRVCSTRHVLSTARLVLRLGKPCELRGNRKEIDAGSTSDANFLCPFDRSPCWPAAWRFSGRSHRLRPPSSPLAPDGATKQATLTAGARARRSAAQARRCVSEGPGSCSCEVVV